MSNNVPLPPSPDDPFAQFDPDAYIAEHLGDRANPARRTQQIKAATAASKENAPEPDAAKGAAPGVNPMVSKGLKIAGVVGVVILVLLIVLIVVLLLSLLTR